MYKGYSQHSPEAPLPTNAMHSSSRKRDDGEMSNSYSNEFRPTTLPDGPVNGARPGTRDGPMSHSYSGNTLVSPGSGNHSPMVAIPRVRNIPIRREQPVLSKDDPLYQLHGANGERTISAGAYVPQPGNRLIPNSFVAQRVESFNNGRLDRRASAGGRLAPASGRSTPLSYNLRRTTPPEGGPAGSGSGPGRLVAHYYPPESVASTASEPIGSAAGASRVLPTSASLQLQRGGSAAAYAPTPSSSSTEPPTLTTPSESHSSTYPHDSSTPRGAPVAAIREARAGGVHQQQIPETDILDSSCSDDDDAVRGCETESFRQDTGQGLPMNHDEEQYATSTDDESEDPEYLELREREQIVERYEMGPESKDVDPWENPDFELYHITDRFGFVHKNKPPKTKEEQEKDRVERELRRVKKWQTMIDEWKHRHPAKLPQRIWKGVPERLRIIVWQKLLNVADMKSNARDNMYRELLMRARLISKDIKQIDLDINRTYRDHLAFRRRYDVKQQSLFNVLSAYALFNTEVGYCQGMSQIAAIFLMYMDEEDAFWCLHSLMVNRKYTMHGFFVPGFPKLKRFQDHYEAVLKKYVPGVKKHLDKVDIPPIYVTKWWFGCFLDRVPFPLALRLWDVFLYYGDCIFIAMSYNIMKMHQKTVKKLNMETFMEFIQSRIADDFGYSDDKVMESLEECLRKLQNDRMALPPPPGPGDPAEVPTKPMGEALTRSMIDIRMSIAELHSRASRANSLAGRSPALRRRQSKRNPPSPMPSTVATNGTSTVSSARAAVSSTTSTVANDSGIGTTGRSPTMSPSAASTVNGDRGTHKTSTASTVTAPTGNDTRATAALPLDPFRRSSVRKRAPTPPTIPDSDGFVPMSPRSQHSRSSYYDNVTPTSSVAGVPGYGRGGGHGSYQHSRETSGDRVQRMPNNITHIEIGEVLEEPPFEPPPDYDYPPQHDGGRYRGVLQQGTVPDPYGSHRATSPNAGRSVAAKKRTVV